MNSIIFHTILILMVPLKSSGYSIWPIHVTINEIIPRERNKHTVLSGLWFGYTEPDMTLFLQPFVDDAENLATTGIKWQSSNGKIISSKFVPLVAAVDSVARPMLQNTTQYNGMFGCAMCKHPGKQAKRGNGTAHIYPLQNYSDRTDEETVQHMRQAVRDGKVIMGVKGPSVLINLPYFNIVSGFSHEYMHSVLLGVTRQMTYLFLTSVGTDFSIGSPRRLNLVNSRLSGLTPTSEITRCPRSLKGVKYWKASEWRTWLLFYCIPCLRDIIPARNLQHLLLLSKAIFILLKAQITYQEINKAHEFLIEFVGKMEILYGPEECKFNVHLLTHLAMSVKNWGPLLAHSAFGFESANGRLAKLIKGTQYILKQITRRFLLSKALPCFSKHVQFNPSCQELYEKLTDLILPRVSAAAEIDKGFVMLGRPSISKLSAEEAAALLDCNVNPAPDEIAVYKRMIYQKCLLHSTQYTRATKRNNTIIMADNTYYKILKLATYKTQREKQCVLFVKPLNIQQNRIFGQHSQLQLVVEGSGLFAIKIQNVQQKCIYIYAQMETTVMFAHFQICMNETKL
ncbi:uncharacterized protein LOC117108209 [Anneissia japonica]|uniref:uncharacterized protein LOC117108209 n=1 Tax=Anneissia japonica TaxID=1529436 RepID=UPI001425A8E3|nr:uncharacterized protein LOC117108209 [Anneissia japonica]